MNNYISMSINDIIKLINKKDNEISELKNRLSEIKNNIEIIGKQNRKLKRDNERYQERLMEVLYKDQIRNCSTCKYNIKYPPEHTCDICCKSDQEEKYVMWEHKND